jgi:hypothetical protein
MTVDAMRYRPLPISQRDTLLAANGVDDCRAVCATYLAATATSGEILITPRGNQMGRRQRTALVKRARRSLGPALATGGLPPSATTQMLRYLVPWAPTLLAADLTFPQLRAKLLDGHCASLSGNPGDIQGTSPLKRAGDVGHEMFLWGGTEVRCLVGDSYKPYSKRFGEWRPWSEVRQFAWKDSDRTLTACFVVKRGSWTMAAIADDDWEEIERRRDARIMQLRADLRAATEELEECRADCGDGATEALLDDLTEWIEARRG